MNMFHGLNRQEAPAPKRGEAMTALDLGFHTGQIVRFKDPSSKKMMEGKIAGVGFDSAGKPEVAIEVPEQGLYLTVPQEEFFRLNTTKEDVVELADAFNEILQSDDIKSGDFN